MRALLMEYMQSNEDVIETNHYWAVELVSMGMHGDTKNTYPYEHAIPDSYAKAATNAYR